MFGGSKETDSGEDGQAFFKPVKNPRRPRDAGPETADDDKPSSSSLGSGAKGADEKGGNGSGEAGGGGDGADDGCAVGGVEFVAFAVGRVDG